MKKSEYETISISKKVGCGDICCMFEEDEKTFHKLTIVLHGTRETLKCPHCDKEIEGEYKHCEDIWFVIASKIITYGLRRGIWEGTIERGLLKHLINKTFKCKRYIPNKDHICSCPDAIGEIITKYGHMRDLLKPKPAAEPAKH